jgi:hypothetical protein
MSCSVDTLHTPSHIVLSMLSFLATKTYWKQSCKSGLVLDGRWPRRRDGRLIFVVSGRRLVGLLPASHRSFYRQGDAMLSGTTLIESPHAMEDRESIFGESSAEWPIGRPERLHRHFNPM